MIGASFSYTALLGDAEIAEKTVRLFLSSKAVVSSRPVNKTGSFSSKTVVFLYNLSAKMVVSAKTVSAIPVVYCIFISNQALMAYWAYRVNFPVVEVLQVTHCLLICCSVASGKVLSSMIS